MSGKSKETGEKRYPNQFINFLAALDYRDQDKIYRLAYDNDLEGEWGNLAEAITELIVEDDPSELAIDHIVSHADSGIKARVLKYFLLEIEEPEEESAEYNEAKADNNRKLKEKLPFILRILNSLENTDGFLGLITQLSKRGYLKESLQILITRNRDLSAASTVGSLLYDGGPRNYFETIKAKDTLFAYFQTLLRLPDSSQADRFLAEFASIFLDSHFKRLVNLYRDAFGDNQQTLDMLTSLEWAIDPSIREEINQRIWDIYKPGKPTERLTGLRKVFAAVLGWVTKNNK